MTDTLLKDHDFRHLWTADALSAIGSRLSLLAVPLLALITLDASTLEVSMLRTLETTAALLLGLVAGAWMDRVQCRPVLIAADLGRGLLLASIPVAALAGVLTMAQLYIVVFLVGIGTVYFDVGATTYLPRILHRDHLVEANAKLATNQSVAAVLAGGAGGFIVQWLTAPVAIAIDAVSYLWSALWLRGIRATESVPPRAQQTRLRSDIAEGLRFVLRNPILRPLAGYSVCTMLFQSMEGAIGIVFLAKNIGLSPGAIGLVSMTGLLGAIAAGMVTGRVAARVGSARTMWITALIYGAGFLLFPLTGRGWALSLWVVGGILSSFAIIAMHIMAVSTRQRLCPPELYGRVGATMEFAIWGIMPIGSLLGGILATLTDVRTTLWVVGIGTCVSILWIVASPLRNTREVPDSADHAHAA